MTGPDVMLLLALACGAVGTPAATDAPPACAALEQQAAGEEGKAQTPASTPAAAEQHHGNVWRSITLGVGFNENYPNGEFVRFSIWKPYTHGLTLDFAEQHAGDDSSVGFSVTYSRNLDAKTAISANVSTGTQPFAPKYGFGASISRPLFSVGVIVGASHRMWRDGSYTTEVGIGLQRWFPHWIVGGGATYSEGEPASFTGWRGSLGLTYYIWKKTYASVSFDFGTLNQRDWQYDTRSKGLNFGFSQYFTPTSGVAVSAGRSLDTDVYGVSLSWFKEW